MKKQSYFEFVKDMLLSRYYYETTEQFREELDQRLEEMFQTEIDSAYKRGRHDGHIEGLEAGINLMAKHYEDKM